MLKFFTSALRVTAAPKSVDRLMRTLPAILVFCGTLSAKHIAID
jgi:hypothetical protein